MSIINIKSFVPETSLPGVAVSVETEGLDGYEGQDAIISAAVWVPMESTGALTSSPQAILIDTEHYTEFTVMLPENVIPGKYTLQIYLRIGNESFDFDSGAVALTVTASSGDKARIDSITPMRTTIEDLQTKRFVVQGHKLDEVGLWTIASRPNVITMSTGEKTSESVMLRVLRVPEGIQPGRYKLKGMVPLEGQISSPSSIVIDK